MYLWIYPVHQKPIQNRKKPFIPCLAKEEPKKPKKSGDIPKDIRVLRQAGPRNVLYCGALNFFSVL